MLILRAFGLPLRRLVVSQDPLPILTVISVTGKVLILVGGYTYANAFTSGDIIGVALDLDNGSLVFYKNGVSQGTAFTGLAGGFRPAIRAGKDDTARLQC